MNISLQYHLGKTQEHLDFIDVKLDTDNLLFIDPRLIEAMGKSSKLYTNMQLNIEAFWGELIKSIKLKDAALMNRLLSGLSEPNETRLGYAFSKHTGNSIGKKLKPKLIKAIISNKAVKTGILSHFSDVELFIEDISCDRVSDITTKIIKSALIGFTQEQCNLLKIPMAKLKQKDIFNHLTFKWEIQEVELPIDDYGKAVIFVPKEIVRLENSATSNISCFYRYAIRKFIKHDKDMLKDISGSGKNKEIQLCDIKSEFPLSKESLTEWTHRFPKLLVDYKTDHMNVRLKPLTTEQIERIVYSDIYKQVG